MNARKMFARSVVGVAMLCLAGCVGTDAVTERNKAPRCVKYVMRAVNSIEARTSQGTIGQGEITPWTLTLEADTNLADMMAAPEKTKCSMRLEHAKLAAPLVVDFTLRKKPPEPMTYEGMEVGITQFGWETAIIPIADGWKLKFMLSGLDYPIPEPIAAMLTFGAYMRENYGTSVFSEDGVLLVVGYYEKDKTVVVDLTRYTAKSGSLASRKQMFKRFVHGELSQSITPVGEKAREAK